MSTPTCLLTISWLPVAHVIGVAFSNAFLHMGHSEGVNKVSPAFVLLVAFSSWATGNERCIINSRTFPVLQKCSHSFSPLMQSGQIASLGSPDTVQFWKARQSDWSGCQDHQLHPSNLPQNEWQSSAFSCLLKSMEYSYWGKTCPITLTWLHV